MTRLAGKLGRPSTKRARKAAQCNARGCDLPGHYEIGVGRKRCAAHAAIVLLARAISEALAADNAGGR